MSHLPKGCDYQGRHPEAAHCATEVGNDDCNSHRASDVFLAIVLVAVSFGLAVILAASFR